MVLAGLLAKCLSTDLHMVTILCLLLQCLVQCIACHLRMIVFADNFSIIFNAKKIKCLISEQIVKSLQGPRIWGYGTDPVCRTGRFAGRAGLPPEPGLPEHRKMLQNATKHYKMPQNAAERHGTRHRMPQNATEQSLAVNYQGPTLYISDRNDVINASSFNYELNEWNTVGFYQSLSQCLLC